MNNDDKLREQLKSEPVPDRLRPENIKKMLNEQAPKKKRSGIKTYFSFIKVEVFFASSFMRPEHQ